VLRWLGEGGIGPRGDPAQWFSLRPRLGEPDTRGRPGFELSLPARIAMTLRVFDVNGRQVGDVAGPALRAGRHRVTWEPIFVTAVCTSPGARAIRPSGERKIVVVVR
jgi:hypothetical protein